MFDNLPSTTADPLHAVMDRFKLDPRPGKIDLGVGVFRTPDGLSHIFSAVAEAERRLAELRRSKEYLPLAGDPAFVEAMAALLTGEAGTASRNMARIQATGGTGALRLGLELVARAGTGARVHLGLPSWPNHSGLAKSAGLRLLPHRYLMEGTASPDLDAMRAAAASVEQGDIFILHGPCHNPSGRDLPRSFRDELIAGIVSRGGIPFIDAAYCGLAEGLETDLLSLRHDLDLAPRALVAWSCSKTFGLYRERTAMLLVQCTSRQEQTQVQGNLEEISRTLVSMPPAHGAAVVATVLGHADLRASWRDELRAYQRRIVALRTELEALSSRTSALRNASDGKGIFMLLPIDGKQVGVLERDHGIYLPASGRINITGLKPGDPARLAEALIDAGA